MEGLKGMFKGKGKGASSSRGTQGKVTSSSHLIPTQDDFVDTQHFPTIPLDLDQELFSGTQEDFNDTPTNVDDNTPTSAHSIEIPHIPPNMRRGPEKRPLKSDAWTFFDRDVENQVAICKICKNVLKFKTGKGHGGTGGLIRHVVSAHPARHAQYQASKPGAQTSAPSGQGSHTDTVTDQVQGQINLMTGGIACSKYNKHRDREAISKLVVVEGLPFSFPSSPDFIHYIRDIYNPAFNGFPRSTVKRDVYKFAHEYQQYLHFSLYHFNGKVSITSDIGRSTNDHDYLTGSVPYQEVINEDAHEDLLKYWRRNEKTFPTLSLMARDVLNIQASSTASESTFSAGRYQIGDHRHSLAETAWKLQYYSEIGYERSGEGNCEQHQEQQTWCQGNNHSCNHLLHSQFQGEGLNPRNTTDVGPNFDGKYLHKILREELGETRLHQTLTNVIIPSFDINNLLPTIFFKLEALIALSTVTKRAAELDLSFAKIKPLDVKRILLLSLGTGAANYEGKYKAKEVTKWGAKEWLKQGDTTPIVDIMSAASHAMIDDFTSTIYHALDDGNNYLRFK
ncbi:hypothetical protein RND71_032315 [Anisodus tanguticus]|uniref:BED-type domain-containing protein n=1 Tax=Anisodus tanguticus TaxID=243964 RepID=A0AAE1RDF8_9SOLA|nr:hypothetical protein RND71_032315 [Anisodus tanguticus]